MEQGLKATVDEVPNHDEEVQNSKRNKLRKESKALLELASQKYQQRDQYPRN
jgi:hypothetical protein